MIDIKFNYSARKTQMIKHHFHDSCEVYYLKKGQRYYFIKNNTYLILPGDLVIIRENLIHKTISAGEHYHERYLLDIDRNYVKSTLGSLESKILFKAFDEDIFVLRKQDNTIIDNIFNELHQLHDSNINSDYKRLKTFSLTLQILIHISETYKSYTSESDNKSVNKRIQEITTFINENYASHLTLDYLSKEFNMSYFYLCKLFKNYIGFTFTDYINSVRIRKAKNLLLSTDYNITHISELVGYADVSYFCRIFKKIMKITALKYRKENSKLI